MAEKEPSLDSKIKLLRWMLREDNWQRSDISEFWDKVSVDIFSFLPIKGPKELERWWDQEELKWIKERSNPDTSRRTGHRAGSEYDALMAKWTRVRDTMLVEHWARKMEKLEPRARNYLVVPEYITHQLRKEMEKRDKSRKSSERQSVKKPRKSSTSGPHYEYDGEKLKRVVEAAKTRAIEVGKPDLAAAVNEIYQSSLTDAKLRALLEAILTQTADAKQNADFQAYVRNAKKKLRDGEAVKTTASTTSTSDVPVKKSSPQVQLTRGKKPETSALREAESVSRSTSGVMTPTSSSNVSDSAYGSQGPTSDLPVSSSLKRKQGAYTNAGTSGADNDDEAGQAAKRSKQAHVYDSTECRRVEISAASHRNRTSRDSSPLSSPCDTDIEAAKEAYVDEMVQRKSADGARQVIEDEYGPVSPSIASNDEDMEPNDLEPGAGPQPERHETDREPAQRQPAANTRQSDSRSRIPTPPPSQQCDPSQEQLTPGESSHAYQLIASAAAEAVNPTLARLEEKIDSFVSARNENPASSSSKDLAQLADMLKSGILDSQGPELVQLISLLTRNAAEASIAAAEAARKAGEVARDVSMLITKVNTNSGSISAGAAQRESKRSSRSR